MTARCIAFVEGRRCPRVAAKRNGDLYVCGRHGLITMAIIDDWLAPATRRMLVRSSWETRAEGQRLINRMYGREAA
jgi:hypothetical protein